MRSFKYSIISLWTVFKSIAKMKTIKLMNEINYKWPSTNCFVLLVVYASIAIAVATSLYDWIYRWTYDGAQSHFQWFVNHSTVSKQRPGLGFSMILTHFINKFWQKTLWIFLGIRFHTQYHHENKNNVSNCGAKMKSEKTWHIKIQAGHRRKGRWRCIRQKKEERWNWS